MEWNGTEISVWNMEDDRIEWNGRFQEWNERQSSILPYQFQTRFRHGICRKIYTYSDKLVHCLPSFQSIQWTMGHSQLMMQEVQLKIKIIKIKKKRNTTVCFPLKSSSGGVELNKNRNKTITYISTSAAFLHSLTGSSVAGTSTGQPTWANRGTHRPEPVAVTWVGGEGPRVVQNTVSTNCGG